MKILLSLKIIFIIFYTSSGFSQTNRFYSESRSLKNDQRIGIEQDITTLLDQNTVNLRNTA